MDPSMSLSSICGIEAWSGDGGAGGAACREAAGSAASTILNDWSGTLNASAGMERTGSSFPPLAGTSRLGQTRAIASAATRRIRGPARTAQPATPPISNTELMPVVWSSSGPPRLRLAAAKPKSTPVAPTAGLRALSPSGIVVQVTGMLQRTTAISAASVAIDKLSRITMLPWCRRSGRD